MLVATNARSEGQGPREGNPRTTYHIGTTPRAPNPATNPRANQATEARGGAPEGRIPHRYPAQGTHPSHHPIAPQSGSGNAFQMLARCVCLIGRSPSSMHELFWWGPTRGRRIEAMSNEFMELRENVKYRTGGPAALEGQWPPARLSKKASDCVVNPLGT